MLFLGIAVPVLGSLICASLLPDWRWVGIPFHSTVEALGLFAGVSLAVLLTAQQGRGQIESRYWIAAALLGMGILDGFHSAVSLGDGFVYLHSAATLVGGLLFAMVWLSIITSRPYGGALVPGIVSLAAFLLGTYSVLFPNSVPQMLQDGAFTPTATIINKLSGIFFAVAAVGFFVRHRAKPNTGDILFASFCLFSSSAGFLFESSQPWDAAWWLWRGLRLLAFLILLGYILLIFRQTTGELESRLEELAANRLIQDGVIKEIHAVVNQLGSTASEMSAASTQVAAGTTETAASTSKTATTVEEVLQSAQVAMQRANAVSERSQRVVQVSADGGRAVQETVEGMHRIREQMAMIAKTVVQVGDQGQAIGGIIAVVTKLADQSNLLAVNAAIEAAQAGEQGKGFGVVAQEIRNLAQQSKEATMQIRGILGEVQKTTANAVVVTEQGSNIVKTGVERAEQAGEAIRVLGEATEEAFQAALHIGASSRQQVMGIEQVGKAMDSIDQSSVQNASSTKQLEAAAKDLQHLGQKLETLANTLVNERKRRDGDGM